MSKKLKVLFFQSQSYFGSDSMIHSLLMRHYDRSRVEVHVACNYGTRRTPSASLKALQDIADVHIRPTNFGPTIKQQSKRDIVASTLIGGAPAAASLGGLALYIKRHGIDVIHGTEKPRDAFYGVLMGKLTGAKSVVHLHVKCEDWLSPLVKWALREADAIIGVSEFVAKSTVAEGYDPRKVHYVLNSIDASRWNPTADGSVVRREFGIAPEAPMLAIASRLFYWKGHIELLKALAMVRQEVPNVKLLIVGDDDPRAHPGGGSFLQELKELVHELGLTENVIFTGFRSDIQGILAACDIYAMPSFEEPCAVAFLEAMAMKKPVLALDSGGTSQLVEHGKAGLLSAPQDIEALAANMLGLIGDPGLRRNMGDRGRARVEQYLNPLRMAEETERIYRNLLYGRSANPQAAHIYA